MKNKKIYLSLGTLASSIAPIAIVVSCNVNFKKNMKHNSINDNILFKSKEAKELKAMIQDEFQKRFLWKTYTSYFDENKKPALWDSKDEVWKQNPTADKSPIVYVKDENLLTRAILNIKGGQGNLAGDIIGSIEDGIWKNKSINVQVRSLLNNIRTLYNRTKQVYPIEQRIIQKNGHKFAKIVYQVDFLSTLSRRFMTHFMTLTGIVPLQDPTDKVFRDQIYNYQDKFFNFGTSTKILDVLYNNPTTTKTIPKDWFGPSFLNISSSNPLQNFNTLEFVKSANNQKYQLQYIAYNSASIVKNDGSFEDSGKIIAKLKDSSGKVIDFNKTDTMEKVKNALLSSMFTDNENDYVKSFFAGINAWVPNIEIVNLAGSSIEGITIDDYLRHFMHTTQVGTSGIPYDSDMAHFNIYAARKFKDFNGGDKIWSWKSINNQLTTNLKEKDVI